MSLEALPELNAPVKLPTLPLLFDLGRRPTQERLGLTARFLVYPQSERAADRCGDLIA